MPHYYFHIASGLKVQDKVGEDFATSEQAIAHAEQVASELGRNSATYRFYELCVTDEKETEIARVPIVAWNIH